MELILAIWSSNWLLRDYNDQSYSEVLKYWTDQIRGSTLLKYVIGSLGVLFNALKLSVVAKIV